MNDAEQRPLPDRVCSERGTQFFDPYCKKIGVKFNGRPIFDCVEYCVSEGWVRRPVWEWTGKPRTANGRIVTITYSGEVELYRR